MVLDLWSQWKRLEAYTQDAAGNLVASTPHRELESRDLSSFIEGVVWTWWHMLDMETDKLCEDVETPLKPSNGAFVELGVQILSLVDDPSEVVLPGSEVPTVILVRRSYPARHELFYRRLSNK